MKSIVRAVLLASCAAFAPLPAHAALIYGVNTVGDLISFESAAPGAVLTAASISGLQPNERLVGIDFRTTTGPNNGVLYAVGSFSRIYRLNLATGAATFVSTLTDSVTGLPVTLNGTEFAVDYNPQDDRLRVISNLEQNLRINLDSGSTNIDATVGGASSPTVSIVGTGYDNIDTNPMTPTTLWGLDSQTNTLVRFTNPDAGTYVAIGPLGIDPTALLSLDIEEGTNTAYAAVQLAGETVSRLYTVNLTTGLASPSPNLLNSVIGTEEDGFFVRGIAIAPAFIVPEPSTLVLASLAAGLLLVRGRRRRA